MRKNSGNNFFYSLFIREKHFGLFTKIGGLINSFGHAEKTIFLIFSFLLSISGLILTFKVNEAFIKEIPGEGGVLNEGIIGSVRFINPVLAVSDTDKAMVNLIYSGLLKPDEENFKPDLAEKYEISEDGLIYSLKIRDDAYFHDGKPITSDDVIFTIEKVIDPVIKSPKKNNWDGVTVEKIDSKNLRFLLQKPYYPFIDNLTLAILPKHIWEKATAEEFPFSQWNIEPIGSGPFKLKNVKYNESGIPIFIALKSFKKYTNGKPNISNINVKFFKNSEDAFKAFESGDIDSISGLSIEEAKKLQEVGVQIVRTPMSRVFGAFFNQNHAPVFLNQEVRKALDVSLDKNKLVNEVLLGFGMPLNGIAPKENFKWIDSATTTSSRIEEAKNILLTAGWKENEQRVMQKKNKKEDQTLNFSIYTSNIPELKKTAEIMKDTWSEIGAEVSIKIFEPSDLGRDIIKTRKYDILLFGEALTREADFYPFWHSSQRNDPGLNVALYANITSDKLLEDMRTAKNKTEKENILIALNDEIRKDLPAVFTYTPEFLYVISPKIKNAKILSLGNPSDRFLLIENWYIETDKVWDIFAKK